MADADYIAGMTAAVDVAGLLKTFGTTRALDGLDLTVATGKVHGFLGPNGSGKSTTIRVLLGLLRADGGRTALSAVIPGETRSRCTEMLGMTCVLVAIMASLLVVRRTRGDEEAGRAELVLAGIVGRHASGGAALIVGVGASLAVGLLSSVGLGLLGIESIEWSGSLLYGATLAGTGITSLQWDSRSHRSPSTPARPRVSRVCSLQRRTRCARSATWATVC